MNNHQHQDLLLAVKQASERWKQAFNRGDAPGCAACYEVNAVMKASPFGVFTGTDEITAFWQQLINDGFNDIEYIEPTIELVDTVSAELKSKWKMNKAEGVIHKELWVLQQDGTAKLREDEFEALA